MYASSSNSECDLCYNNYISNNPIQPFYPELGQPLIYYAQVQRKQRPQKSIKKNNCFVKAFRWYTEEHVPQKKLESSAKNEDIQGFAAWLDQKYDEYIRNGQITQMASSQYFLKQTSSVRMRKLSQKVLNETSVPRQNKMKNPWRRRKNYFKKQNGDTVKKSDQSIEFILNPKNLSRSASEFCQKCCRRSNNAITIDRTAHKSKSESIIYILKEKEMFVIQSDSNDTTADKKNCNDNIIKLNNEQIKVNRPSAKDVSCQCSSEKLAKVDASSQFSNTKTSYTCDCVSSSTDVANERMSNLNTVSCTQPGIYQKVLIEEPNVPSLPMDYSIVVSQKSIPNIHSAIVSRETSFSTNKNVGKNERSFSVNGIAQTSDHAINLSNIVKPERIHPMFFKIICVNK